MAGAGAKDPVDTRTLVYIGQRTDDFNVEMVMMKLVGDQFDSPSTAYFKLVILYAILKEAWEQGRSYVDVIGPLKIAALDWLNLASRVDQVNVNLIARDLHALGPTETGG